MKIQRMDRLPDDARQYVSNEFELLKVLESRLWKLNPTYQEIDGDWALLGMDWIEGDLLDDLMRGGRSGQISARALFSKLVQLSFAGVVHRQFRPRHVMRSHDGTLFLIDFGGSYQTRPLTALWRNFVPVKRSGGSWVPRSVLITFYKLLFGKLRKIPQNGDEQFRQVALRKWEANSDRNPALTSEGVVPQHDDGLASRNLEQLETALQKAIDGQNRLVKETWKLQIGNYVLLGNRDWGLFWDQVMRLTNLNGKRVVDLGCGFGPAGVFARLHGASSAVFLEDRSPLIESARNFTDAMGVADNRYQTIDWEKLTSGDTPLPPGDLIFLLSERADQIPFDRVLELLSNYQEVVYETARPEQTASELASRGFTRIETMGRSYGNRSFLYGSSRG